ncbi:MAG TPA: GxxExxY protein [Anaerolineae bacterium]|nr:GxxExxY protein [Anaerolineae bacterium]
MRIEPEKAGLTAEQQALLEVYYDGYLVGDYIADLLIEDRLIAELKAVRALTEQHEVQLVSYLTSTHLEVGLLINLGPSVLVKRKQRQYRLAKTPQ